MIDFRNYKIPTLEDERKRLLDKIPDKFYKDEGSIFFDVMSIIADENINIYKEILNIFKNAFGLTAEGIFLDYKCLEVGIERKQGEKAKGKVKFVGNSGLKINFNTVVVCDDLQYVTLHDKVIPDSGEIEIEIEAIDIGSKYNVLENSINRLGIPISGINSVTNVEKIANGTDRESDEFLRKRYIEKAREQATSGNVYHYKQWALSISGIGQAKVYPLADGVGTVKVILVGSNGQAVSEEKIKEVIDYIELNRPIGASVTVANAIPKKINITANIQKSNLVEIDIIKKQLKEKIIEYISDVNLNSNKISYGKIASIFYDTNGIQDYSNLRINDISDSITILDDEIAVLGDVILNV